MLLLQLLHVHLGLLMSTRLLHDLLDLVATEVGPRRARLAYEEEACCCSTSCCCCVGVFGG